MARLPFPEVEQGPLRMLLRELHELHARAGWPSTRELAREQSFSHVAVHDLMTKVSGPPKLPVLLAVVQQMSEAAPRIDVEAILDNFDKMWRECVGDVARPGGELELLPNSKHDEPLSLEALQIMFEQLNMREMQILISMASGLGITEISRNAHVSHHTARAQVHNLIRKLNVKSRTEAIERWVEYQKLLDREDGRRGVDKHE